MNFSYFTNTQLEYKLAIHRLKILEDRKTEIWQKYFGVKSPNWDKIGQQGTPDQSDKMVKYLAEISQPKGHNLSLEEEIEQIRNEAERLKKVLETMANKLKDTDSIEGKLYYRIVVEGMSSNRAVRETAETEYMTENNIWRTYYARIKEDIRKLRKAEKE